MSKIIAEKFALYGEVAGVQVKIADHLYYEFIDNNGNRIAQINGLSLDRSTQQYIPMGSPFSEDDSIRILVSQEAYLSGTSDPFSGSYSVIYDNSALGSEQVVNNILARITELSNFINAQDLDYTPVPAIALGDAFNSNSAFVAETKAIQQAISINIDSLISFENSTNTPGTGQDILRGQTWTPNYDGSGVIVGSKVTGTGNLDKINYGAGNNILIGLSGDDVFSVNSNPHRDDPSAVGKNTIYGGSEANKVATDASDGTDAYIFDPSGGRQVIQYGDHWDIVTPGNADDTDMLYSIEKVNALTFSPATPVDFRNLNGSLIFQDADTARLASLNQTENGILNLSSDVYSVLWASIEGDPNCNEKAE